MKNFSKLAASIALTVAALQEAHAGVGSLALGYALGSSSPTQAKANPSRGEPSQACFVYMQGLPGIQALVNLAHVDIFDLSRGIILFNSGAQLRVKPFAFPREPEQYRQPGMPASPAGWDSAMDCEPAAQMQSKTVFTFGSDRAALKLASIEAIVIAGAMPPKDPDVSLLPFSAVVMRSDGKKLRFETLAGLPTFHTPYERADWFAKRQEAGSKSSMDTVRMAQDQLRQAGATWTDPRPSQPAQANAAGPNAAGPNAAGPKAAGPKANRPK